MCYLLSYFETLNLRCVLGELEWQRALGFHLSNLSFQGAIIMPKAPLNGKRKREDTSEDRPGPSTKRSKTDITSWVTPRYPWLASIQSASEIGSEHVLALCGLGPLARTPLCRNKFEEGADSEGDVIEVSDSENDTKHSCSKAKCKNNPYCLNYLGQEKWENEGESDGGISEPT